MRDPTILVHALLCSVVIFATKCKAKINLNPVNEKNCLPTSPLDVMPGPSFTHFAEAGNCGRRGALFLQLALGKKETYVIILNSSTSGLHMSAALRT